LKVILPKAAMGVQPAGKVRRERHAPYTRVLNCGGVREILDNEAIFVLSVHFVAQLLFLP
jgi:hypothetical protein